MSTMSDWWLVPLALAAVVAPVVGWLAVRVGAERRACAEANAALAQLLDEVVATRLRRAEGPPERR